MTADIYRALDELLSEGIMVPSAYVRLCDGDWHAAAMLAQIRYWMRNGKDGTPRAKVERDGHRWIVRNHSDWQEELGLSHHQAKRTAAYLQELGLIVAVQTLHSNKRAILYRSDDDAIAAALLPNGAKLHRSNSAKSHRSNGAKVRRSEEPKSADSPCSNGADLRSSSTYSKTCTETRTPADAGGARARAAAPAAAAPQQALFGDLCHAAGLDSAALTKGTREQLGKAAAWLAGKPEADRPDRDALRGIYQAEHAALSARLGRDADALTVQQFRQAIGRWITSRQQEAEDRQRRAEQVLREAEDHARWLAARARTAQTAAPAISDPDPRAVQAWQGIAGQLRGQMSPATWSSWLAPTQGAEIDDDGCLVVLVPSSYAKDWIEQRLGAAMAPMVEAAGLVGPRFVVAADAAEERAA